MDQSEDMMISVHPLLFIEVLYVYVLPDHVALCSMMHGAKVIVTCSKLSEQLAAEVSYTLLCDPLLG